MAPTLTWVMVRDNVTGLIWEEKHNKDNVKNYADPNDADNTYTWYDSNPATNRGGAGTPGDGTDTEDFINDLNAQNFGGFSDWRLPTIKELSYIVNSGTSNPSINTFYFPNTQSSNYWSSTTDTFTGWWAWGVHFESGGVNYYDKSHTYYVRAVRGGSLGHFVDNNDGTVTDTDTGLMWQKGTAPGTYVWQQALSYCQKLTLAGHNDWRLPNRNELQSLVDYSRFDPSINT
ncbi:MAG: DUF1566 domain-containing protein, partial [Proteobacteria bacterium]|nr:DUF1566 domain-containing protein [Pseudomonadota bacterium]